MSANKRDDQENECDESDPIQIAVGNFGAWQAILCTSISMLKVSVAWHQLAILFLAPPLDYWCARPPEFSHINPEQWRNISKPPSLSSKKGSCEMYNFTTHHPPIHNESLSNLSLVTCSSWDYDRSIFDNTIVMEWDLVCGKELLAQTTQTVYMFGILAGNFFFGVLSDKLGRKNPLIWSIVLQIGSGVATAFCTNFYAFQLCRFLDAVATGGCMVTGFVFCMEIVGRKWRAFVSVMYHVPFAIGHLTLPGISYFFRSWNEFQLAISIPSILLLSYYWIMPESPRWLLTMGRNEEASAILKKAAVRNGLPQSGVTLAMAKKEKQDRMLSKDPTEKASFFDLFKYPNLRLRTLCIAFNWFVCGACFFGLAQYMGTIAGNMFLNVAAGGLIEVPGSFFCIYALERFGRKKTLIWSNFLAGLSCLLVVAVPESGAVWAVVTLSTIGIVSMSVAFPTVYLYSGELFPTVVRNQGVGFASMCARVGSMAAPFISSLGYYGAFVPPVVFGVFPLIGCLLCLALPETKNIVLPDSIQDGEDIRPAFSQKKEVTGLANANFRHEQCDVSKL